MTDRVAVLVPVMLRPHNAAPFMASLRASTDLATVYALADRDDVETCEAWSSAGAVVQHGRETDVGISFAQKVNRGYRDTTEPWLFLTGDDVRFQPGWLDEALRVAEWTGACVVGTNDLGNHRVVAGEHATHMLIRRSYVDQHGASWDGPGVVCHEGYRHWYVDDELVTCAKQRGVWAAAPESVVEHLHPLWGKAADDPVYQVGRAHAHRDGQLFQLRAATYAR